MNLSEIIAHSNAISDETIPIQTATGFLNDAVAKINIECKTKFPYFNVNDPNTEYAGFTEEWQRGLLIPFVVGRIKQVDSSQFEYSDAFREFELNLISFRSNYVVPDEYKSVAQGAHFDDFTGNYWRWG